MNDFVKDFSKAVNKDLGDDITMLIEDGSPSDVKVFIPTGSTMLDLILANQFPGGVPVGKMSEVTGLEGTGKTLLAMQLAANAQKMGSLIMYIDTEHALNSDFAKRVGLDVKSKDFIYMSPSCIEDAFSVIFKLLSKLDEAEKKSKEIAYKQILIIWDSIAATPCKTDVDTENPNARATMGEKPRVLSKNIATLLNATGRQNVALFFINQLRMKMNVQAFADPYVAPGGFAIPYASSVRIRLATISKIKTTDKEIIGVEVKATVKKTRFGPPHRDCVFPVYFANGIDDVESMMNYAIDRNAIKSKNGGSKGTQVWFKDEDDTKSLSKKEFKMKALKDLKIKEKLQKACAEAVIKILENPEEHDLIKDSNVSDVD